MMTSQDGLEPSPMASEDALIKEKILQRGELAKMTRQLKERLYKAGLKVKDKKENVPSSSPTKSISDDISNNITATAMSNIQNSKLTPLKNSKDTNNKFNTDMTPLISPLKRRKNSFYDPNETYDNVSPLKRHNALANLNSSPILHHHSPYSSRNVLQTPQSLPQSQQNQKQQQQQPPKTPPQPKYATLNTKESNDNSNDFNSLLSTPKSSQKTKSSMFLTPNQNHGNNNNSNNSNSKSNPDNVGADLLLYLLKSPANTTTTRDVKQMNNFPTTPKLTVPNANSKVDNSVLSVNLFGDGSSNHYMSNFSPNVMASGQRCPQTPNTLLPIGNHSNNIINTPINLSRFQTPMTPKRLNRTPGFSLMDFINFSPNCTRTPDLNNHDFGKLANNEEDH